MNYYCSILPGYVGPHHYCWICRKNIFSHWLETWLGLWTQSLNAKPFYSSSKQSLHLFHTHSGLKVLSNCLTFLYSLVICLKEAVARGFEIEIERFNSPECYFKSLAKELEPKREFMAKFLTDVGMKPIIPEGGYFMMADWSSLGN